MNTNRQTIPKICTGGAIAAIYAILTLLLQPISFGYGGVFQCRISEALTLLPVLSASAVPGLAIGCLIANLLGGAALPDIIFGALATLLGAVLTRRFAQKRLLAAMMPVIINTLVIGGVLSVLYHLNYFYAALTVLPGEFIACIPIGLTLLKICEEPFNKILPKT